MHVSQEEESAFVRGRPMGILFETRSGCKAWGLRLDAVLHGPTVVHLHPTRIPDNRVLPRAESATGCIYRRLRSGARAVYG